MFDGRSADSLSLEHRLGATNGPATNGPKVLTVSLGMLKPLLWANLLLIGSLHGTTGWAQSATLQADPQSAEVDFGREIRPILADNCFQCHGPDAHDRAADLRLDIVEPTHFELGILVPNDPGSSELIIRVTSTGRDRMPPAESGKSLSAEQIELLRRWIEQGAQWQPHWAFVAAEKPPMPGTGDAEWAEWIANPIDSFIASRMAQSQLTPNPPADPQTLIRRVTLDLTGLPPTAEEVAAFAADPSPQAYEMLVDRLLASPRYGEHMARYWLDAVRYGDTHGLHLDNYREMWLYRDWVIAAFNDNKRYDEFLIEQLAGDLLPSPSRPQLIASGFNRAHVTTHEGGSIVEEVEMRNVVDRTSTFGTVTMGLTLGCAVCHDHKYDPISQREFFQLYAFFNSIDANPLDGNAKDHAPVLRMTNPEQDLEITTLEARLALIGEAISAAVSSIDYRDPGNEENENDGRAIAPQDFVWIDDDLPEGAKPNEPWQFVTADEGPVYSGTKSSTRTADGLGQHFFLNPTTPLTVGEGDVLFAYVYLDPEDPPRQIMLQWHTATWDHRAFWGEDLITFGVDGLVRMHQGDLPPVGQWTRLEVPITSVGLAPGAKVRGWAFTQHDGRVYWDRAGIVTRTPQNGYESYQRWLSDKRADDAAGLQEAVASVVKKEDAQWSEDDRQLVLRHFIEFAYVGARPVIEPLHAHQREITAERDKLFETIPLTLISKETPEPRAAFIMERGQYDQPGEQVHRDVPDMLPPLPESYPRDRLGLARWVASAEHPLTARVAVNRFWQQLFGVGLVRTSEDFGVQGERPSHPDLLDWLAVDFAEHDWDVRRLMKTLVMSATYRQSSRVEPHKLEIDPDNRLLARGPRFRLDAEMLRDQALAVSGLLVEQIGGPGVKPPQPDLWSAVGYVSSNTAKFKPDAGPDKVHRRSVYTFWKRTAPPPQMSTFDAPSRESPCVRRERTNTPLQALLMMNDPQYVEAARALAEQVLGHSIASEDPTSDDQARFEMIYRRALGRSPDHAEQTVLSGFLQANREEFQNSPELAAQLIALGDQPSSMALSPIELAAWTMVANLVMNTDEFVSKN